MANKNNIEALLFFGHRKKVRMPAGLQIAIVTAAHARSAQRIEGQYGITNAFRGKENQPIEAERNAALDPSVIRPEASCSRPAKDARLPKAMAIADTLAAAPHYPEENGVRLVVHRVADPPVIRKIAAVKLEN